MLPRAPRFKLPRLNIVYDTGQEYWIGPVVNISASGIFVETTHELPDGTLVSMMPQGVDDERFPFELQGRVVRVQELDYENHWNRTPGIAIRFEGLDDDQRQALHRYLEDVGTRIDPISKDGKQHAS